MSVGGVGFMYTFQNRDQLFLAEAALEYCNGSQNHYTEKSWQIITDSYCDAEEMIEAVRQQNYEVKM
jgi:hypothetical protein